MNTSIYSLLTTDFKFKRNVKIATGVLVSVSLYCIYQDHERRITDLEQALKGTVDVTLESIEPFKPTESPDKGIQVRPKDDKISMINHHDYKIVMDGRDIDCLAKNIFYEARFEPYIGKIAVAQVTFNRVLDGRWGDSICKVVYAHKQFSWTLKRNLVNRVPKGRKWQEAKYVAKMFQNGVRVRNLSHAKWYHADYVKPRWQDDYRRVHKYGLHIFYEEKKHHNLTEHQLLMANQ